MRALRMAAVAGWITLMAAAAGCRGGKGAEAPGGGGASPDEASREELQERQNKVVRLVGGMVFETVIHYEGGPNESWVAMSHDGRPMQPDLELKPGAGDKDDIDVKPVAPTGKAWTVPLRVPEWCEAYDGAGQKMSFRNLEKGFLATDEAGAFVEDLRIVAIAGCDRLKYAPRQRRVQALLQAFVNKTGIARAELVSLLTALAAPAKPENQLVAYPCGKDPTVRHLLCGPKAAGVTTDLSRSKGEKSDIDRLDELERKGALDDAAKLGILLTNVVQLKHLQFGGIYNAHPTGTFQVVAAGHSAEAQRQSLGQAELLAVLSLDLDKVAFTELGLTLAAKESDPVVQYLLLRRLAAVEEMTAKQLATVSEDQKAKARAGMDAWRKAYDANKADMDAAFKVSADPKDADACTQVDAAFARLLKAKAPKSLKEAYATALDPAVNVVLGAREACHKAKGWTSVAMWEGKLLAEARSHLGPRRAAVFAFRPGKAADRLGYLPDEQIVKGTKAAAGGVQIDFKPKEWLEERENCVETNRVDRITSDGDIIYRTICTPLAPIKHSEPYPPASVDAASGGALKKDNVVILVRQNGVPEMLFSAHTNEKSYEEDKGLRVFLGVPLL